MGVKINMKHEDHSMSLCHSSYETLMVNMMKILDQEHYEVHTRVFFKTALRQMHQRIECICIW